MSDEDTGTESATDDGQQDSTDWRAEARKWEQRAKDNRKEAAAVKEKASKFDELVASQQSEQEKAVEAARKEATSQARAELMRERVMDKLEVAVAGMNPADLEAVVLKLAKDSDAFVSDGQIDMSAIKKAAEQLRVDSPRLFDDKTQTRQPGSFDQGHRTTDKPSGREAGMAEAQRRFGIKSTT